MSELSGRKPERQRLKYRLLNRLLYAVIAAAIFGGLVFFIDGRFNLFAIVSFMIIFFVATTITDYLGKRL